MPLRLKILALASVLLVAFAITTLLSAYHIRQVMEELGRARATPHARASRQAELAARRKRARRRVVNPC